MVSNSVNMENFWACPAFLKSYLLSVWALQWQEEQYKASYKNSLYCCQKGHTWWYSASVYTRSTGRKRWKKKTLHQLVPIHLFNHKINVYVHTCPLALFQTNQLLHMSTKPSSMSTICLGRNFKWPLKKLIWSHNKPAICLSKLKGLKNIYL